MKEGGSTEAKPLWVCRHQQKSVILFQIPYFGASQIKGWSNFTHRRSMEGAARVRQNEKKRDEMDICSPSLRMAQFLHGDGQRRDAYSHSTVEMC